MHISPLLKINIYGIIKKVETTTEQYYNFYLIGEKKVSKLLKEDIYLCFKAYPVRQAIVFKGIDD